KALQWTVDHLYREGDHIYITLSLDNTSWASLGAAGAAVDVLQQLRDEAIDAAETTLKTYGKLLTSKKIPHTCELAQGDPRTQLCQFVNDKQCAMLVVGSRGMGAIKRALIGSVSDYCVHHSDIPVIVVKEDA
ncbi:hypothetical protein SARC_13623, partial [Sphaeroforma arctica JP610]